MLTRDFSFKHRWTDYCHSTLAKDLPLQTSFFAVSENSRGSIVCLRAANPVTCCDWAVLFLRMCLFQFDRQQTYVKTKPPNHRYVRGFAARRQTMEPLEFSETAKNDVWSGRIFFFCGMSVVSSMMFEREISCQHVDVKMRMLRFFSVEKSGVIPRWGQSVPDRDFHTCLFFKYNTRLL